MKTKLKQIVTYILGAVLVIGGVVFAGSLTPSVSTNTSNFVTLSDLYNKIIDNTYSNSTHSVSTTSAPVSTMYSLSDIYNAIPTISTYIIINSATIMGVQGTYDISNLTPDKVRAGVTYGTSSIGTFWTCGDDLSYSGVTYNTVQIGTQCWFAQNLMTSTYPNGSPITRGPVDNTWDNTDHSYYAYPPNIDNTAEETMENIISNKLGFVYQWSAAMNGSPSGVGVQGICPTGWHIPSDDEFITLITYLGGRDVAGGKLKEAGTAHWLEETCEGTCYTSGFKALGAGWRDTDGSFYGLSVETYFWSSTESSDYNDQAWDLGLWVYHAMTPPDANNKPFGFSVRCLKN